jgi:hypothetical protein
LAAPPDVDLFLARTTRSSSPSPAVGCHPGAGATRFFFGAIGLRLVTPLFANALLGVPLDKFVSAWMLVEEMTQSVIEIL